MKRVNIQQEDTLSKAQYIESIQEHFQNRVGSKDYSHTGASPFTLREEEAEQALAQAGGCNRAAMALILRAMNYTDGFFAEEAKDLYHVRINLEQFSQDGIVKQFFLKLKDQVRTTNARQQAMAQERSLNGLAEHCPA